MPEAENQCYLIENKIIFNAEKQSLVHVESHEQIKLKATASLCLLLLLKNHGKVVTQNELLAFAWGESHRQVSFNAFYQSILSLRKSFLQMNVEKQIITTIPRKGLLIQQEISIEQKQDYHVADEPVPLPIEKEDVKPPDSPSNEKRTFLNLTEALIILVTALIVGLLLYPKITHEQYFSGYVAAKKYDGQCHYFFNQDASDYIRHENFIKDHPEVCRENKFLYLTAYPETKNISIIQCANSMERSQGNACQSVYYPRYDSARNDNTRNDSK